jgi:murein L,D-transpeptidase YafK
MKFLLFLFFLFFLNPDTPLGTFRQKQMNYTRVREAYSQKEKSVLQLLAQHNIPRDSLQIYLRAFKTEKKMEMWAKNSNDSVFSLIKELPICEMSGMVGPKRKSHDLQVPEGFYHITELNPYSKYYLSMKINYPNASDCIRGVRGHLGNLIYIHGGCESSGCIAMTDEKIKELYIFCVEAYNSGQKEIRIDIFPAHLNDTNFSRLNVVYSKNKDKIGLWAELKKDYDLFNQKKTLPVIRFLDDGTHGVN